MTTQTIEKILEDLDVICKQADQYQINAGYPVNTPAKEIVRHLLTSLTEQHHKELDDTWLASQILWDRMKEWNKEWQTEKPEERALTHEDAMKLIEWKIQREAKAILKEFRNLILENTVEEYGKIHHGDGFLVTNTDKMMFGLNRIATNHNVHI